MLIDQPSFSLASRRYLDRTIVASEHLRKWLIDRGHDGERIGVVKLGVDRDVASASRGDQSILKRELLEVGADVPVVISVARLDSQKRSALLPDILWRTRQLLGWSEEADGPSPLLLMLGDGADRPAIEARIAELGLGHDSIRLLGNVADPRPYLEAADVFILPSVSEGASVLCANLLSRSGIALAINEAMCGKA